MRRADRLFQIVQHLRGGRLVTAAQLAERLEVSERTIYRDILDLQTNGVPIDGERGVGYIMRGGFDLPPLMFTKEEIVSLVAGARLIKAWGGIAMSRAAEEALVKIEAVLPPSEKTRFSSVEIRAPGYTLDLEQRTVLDRLQVAIEHRAYLQTCYSDAEGAVTDRLIRPLALWYWGKVWTLLAWCELRQAFRIFRTDRFEVLNETGNRFHQESGKSVADFYTIMESDGFPKDALGL